MTDEEVKIMLVKLVAEATPTQLISAAGALAQAHFRRTDAVITIDSFVDELQRRVAAEKGRLQ